MPTYEYRCPKCGGIIEEFRSVSRRNEPTQCPQCKVTNERLLASSPEIRMLKDRFTTDFGDGERTYSRSQYLDKCKALNREPVGMLWRGQKGKHR